MQIKEVGKSNSFRAPLLELVIIIGIFALVSVYLLRMFTTADRLQGEAVAMTKALVNAETVADFVRSDKNDSESRMEEVKTKFNFVEKDGKLYAYYNKNWERVDKQSAYIMIVAFENEGTEADLKATITVCKSDLSKEYCKLQVVCEE